jgi:tRNA(Ile)-lysidine synthase
VLLDTLATLAPELGIELTAMHVHHGLSPNADAWAAFCAEVCSNRGVPLIVRHVAVTRRGGQSLEASARAARYAALATADVRFIALAHHADDQAETVLLQLLRGAGPQGLSAMPVLRPSASGPSLLRPFLALPRQAIEDYASARGLGFVEDESNIDVGRKRNFLRHEIAPRLAAAFPGYPATLARAAVHQAEAAQLADALAMLDADGAIECDAEGRTSLDRAALAALAAAAPARAKNLFRWFLHQQGLAAPSTARLAAMLDQLARAAPDARVRLAHGGVEFGVHHGRILAHRPSVAPYAIAWRGEESVALPHGTLEFTSRAGAGIAQTAMASATVTIRPRAGGERLRVRRGGPSRSLKQLLQEIGLPHWQRDCLPLVFCGEALAAVPGIGVDAEFQATGATPGFEIRWHPAAP